MSMEGYKSYRYIAVVSVFIIAASLLVVLTTYAINMLTATGDFNRLLVRWSQNNSNSAYQITQYFETGENRYIESYYNFKDDRMYTGDVIGELMSEKPDADLIFNEFNLEDIHPNEITGLIRIFTLFSKTGEIEEIKNTWYKIQDLNKGKDNFIDSLITLKNNGISVDKASSSLQFRNGQINNHIREMIAGNSAILIMLKRYSLWFTVLLGILIVLIGIIFTVRGVKQINNTEQLLKERDYLAMFPELNQYPVLNVSTDGAIGFMNEAARLLFPDLKSQEFNHPFLKELRIHFEDITSEPGKNMLYEVQIDDKYYQQASHFLSQEKGIHIHSIDITKLKKQQLEIAHNLKEKESLLAEVHHRVKNNMAVITGLLELQEMMGENPESALAESRSRIKSMAIVHELLYQSDTFSEINTTEYLNKIGEHLRLSLSNISSVNVQNEIPTENLNINQAIPLGLLLNEIAFYLCKKLSEKNKQTDLKLQIYQTEQEFCLKITSNQHDVENPLKKINEPTLRMSLIKNLLDQINGTLTMPKSESMVLNIKFSPKIKKGSSSSYI